MAEMVVHIATRYRRFSASQRGRNFSLEFTTMINPSRSVSQRAQAPLSLETCVWVSRSHIAHIHDEADCSNSVCCPSAAFSSLLLSLTQQSPY